ncbi:TPA: O-antigen polysaccharide polymerase Wzy [Clostridium perfringens]
MIISITIYSGIGISFSKTNEKYLIKFMIFMILIVFFTILTIRILGNFKLRKYNDKFDKFCKNNEKFFNIVSFLFICTLLIHLFIPVIRINQLWSPPSPTLINIFERSEIASSGFILSLSDLLNIFLQPFFFIYLFILKEKNKKIKLALYLFFWIYLQYLKIGYMGRNDMIIFFIFILLLYGYDLKKYIKIKKKQIFVIIIGLVLAIPFLIWYESFRLGVNNQLISIGRSLEELFFKECDYPKYYEFINQSISPIKYILWIIFLPIPSLIFPGKPTIEINTIFSEFILGISRKSAGYYVLLPSLMGESFMIFGNDFFWIHAILLGVIIGFIFSYVNRYRYLTFFSLFYSIYILTIGRGGSQGYIGILINSCIPILLLNSIICKKNTYRRK